MSLCGGRLCKDATCAGVVGAWRAEIREFAGPLMRQLTSRMEVHQRSADGHVVNPVGNRAVIHGSEVPRPGGGTAIGEALAAASQSPPDAGDPASLKSLRAQIAAAGRSLDAGDDAGLQSALQVIREARARLQQAERTGQ